jgi:hypothetical protein
MRQEKREQVIKAFTAPNKEAVAGSKADKKSPMVMLLSLKVSETFSSAVPLLPKLIFAHSCRLELSD